MAFAYVKATHASQQEVQSTVYRCKLLSKRHSLLHLPLPPRLVKTSASVPWSPTMISLFLLRFDYHKDISDDNASKDAKQERKGKAITKFYEDVEGFLDDLMPVMARAGIALVDDAWQEIIDATLITTKQGHLSQWCEEVKGRDTQNWTWLGNVEPTLTRHS
ncbi:hypothetical protein BC940DRAFT_336726 [Gongronella butleri]|nr:hypothetical protein BC940DRAFT_336726 [Gongronella butleri]